MVPIASRQGERSAWRRSSRSFSRDRSL